MGNHGKFSVSPLKSDLSFLPSFPQGERVLGDAEVPLYRRRSSVVTGGHFSLVIFPSFSCTTLATRWYRSQLYICVPKQGPLPSTPLCKSVVEDLGTQETLGYLSRPRVGSSSCYHRLEIVLTS